MLQHYYYLGCLLFDLNENEELSCQVEEDATRNKINMWTKRSSSWMISMKQSWLPVRRVEKDVGRLDKKHKHTLMFGVRRCYENPYSTPWDILCQLPLAPHATDAFTFASFLKSIFILYFPHLSAFLKDKALISSHLKVEPRRKGKPKLSENLKVRKDKMKVQHGDMIWPTLSLDQLSHW